MLALYKACVVVVVGFPGALSVVVGFSREGYSPVLIVAPRFFVTFSSVDVSRVEERLQSRCPRGFQAPFITMAVAVLTLVSNTEGRGHTGFYRQPEVASGGGLKIFG